MKRLSLLFTVVYLVFSTGCETEKAYTPPNIILIMGDDMGYSDIGCYGGEINTPNLDKLATNGLRFTQFYNTARCCPTRASLITGLYPQQAGVGHMTGDRGTPAFRGDLRKDALTIAEVLKTAGYSTYMSGKWHVTPYRPKKLRNPDKSNWPKQRGFDRFFGTILGAGSFYDPSSLTMENEYIAPWEDFYYTNAISDYAVERIQEHKEDNPFFMYVSYTAAHWPMQALPEDIAKYKGHYDEGWDVLRENRVKKMRMLGLMEDSWELSPRDPGVVEWSDKVKDKAWEIANMEVYAAMVDNMDQGIGAIVHALEEKGQLENTLIFFLQDNGACAEELNWIEGRPTAEEAKPMGKDQLQNLMIPDITRDGKYVKMMRDVMPGPAESYTAYGLNWANASNTPFRMYKHWVHEGGISTPLVVHWPKGISAKGELRKEPSHLIDIMATCVDVAEATHPEVYKSIKPVPLEGKSLVPAFANQDLGREAIYWEHEGNRAVRMGRWKLVSKADVNSFKWDRINKMRLSDWELFDMESDRTEMHDLASQNPELVQKMATMWLAWGKRTGIIPRPYKE